MVKINSNKISPTAHLTSHGWDKLKFENAHYFTNPLYKSLINGLRLIGFPYFLKKENDYLYNMLEPRHKAINHFMISKFGYQQIIELACGLSPRGITFSEDPEITYIESDLEPMLNLKKNKVSNIYKQKNEIRKNHKFIAVDLINDSLTEKILPLIDPDKKTLIITEGLTPYFDIENLKAIFINISSLLKQTAGGVYITDIYHDEAVRRNGIHSKLLNFSISLLQTKFYFDIDNSNDGEFFLKDCGFDFIESINPLELPDQFGLKNHIPKGKSLLKIYLNHIF